MPEFPNTHEQNHNVLIIITELCKLSFTSDAESSCAKKDCLLCKEPKVPSYLLSPGVVVSLQWVIIQNNPRHMTLIKPERERGDIHKKTHVSPAGRKDCFKLTGVSKQNN